METIKKIGVCSRYMRFYLFVKTIGVKGYLQDRGFTDSFGAQANKRSNRERKRDEEKKGSKRTYPHSLD